MRFGRLESHLFGGIMKFQLDCLELLGHLDVMKRALDLEAKDLSSSSCSARLAVLRGQVSSFL